MNVRNRHAANPAVGTSEERECWMPDAEDFACPECGARTVCEDDYGSGSNHYWLLRCRAHGMWSKSTYRNGTYDGSILRPVA